MLLWNLTIGKLWYCLLVVAGVIHDPCQVLLTVTESFNLDMQQCGVLIIYKFTDVSTKHFHIASKCDTVKAREVFAHDYSKNDKDK